MIIVKQFYKVNCLHCETYHIKNNNTSVIYGGFLMKKKELSWALLILVIILLAYILPYTLLSDVAKWYGSFLAWIILAIIAIGINYFLTKDWGK